MIVIVKQKKQTVVYRETVTSEQDRKMVSCSRGSVPWTICCSSQQRLRISLSHPHFRRADGRTGTTTMQVMLK